MTLHLNIDITNHESYPYSEAAQESIPAQYACNPSKTIMVYGFDHCHMWDVLEFFKNNSATERVYDYTIGGCDINEKDPRFYSPSGASLPKLDEEPKTDSVTRECKTALNKMIADNYKRREKNATAIITPILFCIDTNDNPYPITPDSFCFGKQITYSELRRAYKLCTDPRINSKIRSIARETFQFSHITPILDPLNPVYESSQEHQISPVPAPWEDEGIKTAWEQKRLTKKSLCQISKSHDWRKDLNQLTV